MTPSLPIQSTLSSSPNAAPTTQPPAAPPPGVPSPAPAGDAAAHQKEIDDLRAQLSESQRGMQYWYEKVSGGGEPAPAKPAADADADVDVLDLITTKGLKGLDEVLAKRGFARQTDVDAKVEARAQQLVKETQLVGQYPELKDPKSEFFKSTAAHYGQLKKQGVGEALAMEIAAQRTRLELLESGKAETPAQRKKKDDDQKEADRRARIAAQAGDRGNRAPEGSEDDDTVTPDEQKSIERLAEALDISVEKATERYKARAKKGVQVSSRFKV
jgi:hypothetical protein